MKLHKKYFMYNYWHGNNQKNQLPRTGLGFFLVLGIHVQKVNICRKEKKEMLPGTTCYSMNHFEHTVNTIHLITHLICQQFTGDLIQNLSSWKARGTQPMDCTTQENHILVIWTPVYSQIYTGGTIGYKY